jgi:23S rRNA (uracil1939-C5)-methyltransferase
MLCELTIDKLGAQGDGVAGAADGPVFIPFALPGERVRVEVRGERGTLVEVIEPSPDRVEPLCRHFGRCGGCSLQHLAEGPYLAWKREQVLAALASRGLDAEVEAVRPVAGHSRRRTAFTLRREGKTARVCYHGRKSHELVAIEQCPVLEPRLASLIPRLPRLLAPLVKAKSDAELWLTACDNGVDVTLKGAATPKPEHLARIAEEAPALGVIRLTVNGQMALSLTNPRVSFVGATVTPPPGGFLQAVQAAERELAELVAAGVGDAKEAADLFAGMGAFTFVLARRSRVTAVESDRQALAALVAGSRGAQGLKGITTLGRDLFRDPLSVGELKRFEAVALDPPRAGASAQADELAKSNVSRISMASCSPAAFARDARVLIDGGYQMIRVAPVDQFLFSPHIELVAHFVR